MKLVPRPRSALEKVSPPRVNTHVLKKKKIPAKNPLNVHLVFIGTHCKFSADDAHFVPKRNNFEENSFLCIFLLKMIEIVKDSWLYFLLGSLTKINNQKLLFLNP